MDYELGEVIAERKLVAKEAGGHSREVLVLLGKPKPFPDAPYGDFYCPYQIKGLGSERVGGAGGVDAFQAMQLAMVGIGSELELMQRTHKVQLVWLGNYLGLGFPTKT